MNAATSPSSGSTTADRTRLISQRQVPFPQRPFIPFESLSDLDCPLAANVSNTLKMGLGRSTAVAGGATVNDRSPATPCRVDESRGELLRPPEQHDKIDLVTVVGQGFLEDAVRKSGPDRPPGYQHDDLRWELKSGECQVLAHSAAMHIMTLSQTTDR